jgi:hypothetical protein
VLIFHLRSLPLVHADGSRLEERIFRSERMTWTHAISNDNGIKDKLNPIASPNMKSSRSCSRSNLYVASVHVKHPIIRNDCTIDTAKCSYTMDSET